MTRAALPAEMHGERVIELLVAAGIVTPETLTEARHIALGMTPGPLQATLARPVPVEVGGLVESLRRIAAEERQHNESWAAGVVWAANRMMEAALARPVSVEVGGLVDADDAALAVLEHEADGWEYDTPEYRRIMDAHRHLSARLVSLARPVPTGWVAVPREPTEAMVKAFYATGPYPLSVWAAMLAAAAPTDAAGG